MDFASVSDEKCILACRNILHYNECSSCVLSVHQSKVPNHSAFVGGLHLNSVVLSTILNEVSA